MKLAVTIHEGPAALPALPEAMAKALEVANRMDPFSSLDQVARWLRHAFYARPVEVRTAAHPAAVQVVYAQHPVLTIHPASA